MIVAVARILNGKELNGYRLVQYDYDSGKVILKDILINVLKNAMRQGLKVNNAALIGDDILGTNGSLDRLANIQRGSWCLLGKSPLVVLYRLGDIGYVVSDYCGNVRKWPIEQVITYSKENGIANGKLVKREDGTEFVSAINGEYEVKEVKKKARNVKVDKREILSDTKERRAYSSIIANKDSDISEEVEFSDPFKALNEAQKRVIKEYYTYISVEIYKELKQGVRLDVSPKKVQQLAELRGTAEWDFLGLQLGESKEERCSLGHRIRYVYRARNVDENGEEHILKFGSTCYGDFFNISEEGVRKLVKMASITSKEVAIMSDIAVNNLYDKAWKDVKLLRSITDKLQNRGEPGILELVALFGNTQAKYLVKFAAVNVPYPATLCKRCLENLKKVDMVEILKILKPEHSSLYEELSTVWRMNGIAREYYRYLEFLFRNQLEGVYSYDPINNIGDRGKGKFTKEARYLRKRLLREIKHSFKVSQWSLEEFEAATDIMSIIHKARYIVNNAIRNRGGSELNLYEAERFNRRAEEDEKETISIGLQILTKSFSCYEYGYSAANSSIDLYIPTGKSISDIFDSLEVYRRISSDKYKDLINYIMDYQIKKKEESDRLLAEREKAKEALRLEEEKRREAERLRLAAEKAFDTMVNNTVCTLNCEFQKDGVCTGPTFGVLYKSKRMETQLEEDTDIRIVTDCKYVKEPAKEEDKQETEQGKQETEQDKKESLSDNKENNTDILEKAKNLIEAYPNVKDYSIDITKDIIRRGIEYSVLTYKQKYVVNKAMKLLVDCASADGKEVDTSNLNVTKQLADCPEVKEKVDKLIEYLGGTDNKFDLSSKEIGIIESVYTRERFSTKQLKYIEEAYERLKSL